MRVLSRLILIPLISALIGYLTNVVAINMLFRPRQPIRLFFYEFQGLLPRRQEELAAKIGEVVERELLSTADLVDQINTPEVQERLVDIIVEAVRNRMSEIMPRRLVSLNLVKTIAEVMETALRREAGNLLAQVIETGREELEARVQVKKIVKEKIMSFDIVELERLVKEVSGRELRHIEILGGILGFIIGMIQLAIIRLFS